MLQHPPPEVAELPGPEVGGLRNQKRLGLRQHAVGQVVRQCVQGLDDRPGLPGVDGPDGEGVGQVRVTLVERRGQHRAIAHGAVCLTGLVGQPGGRRPGTCLVGHVQRTRRE